MAIMASVESKSQELLALVNEQHSAWTLGAVLGQVSVYWHPL